MRMFLKYTKFDDALRRFRKGDELLARKLTNHQSPVAGDF